MCILKMKFLPSAVQKLSEQTHRQTDRQTDTQTDRQTRLKLLPTAYADGKNPSRIPDPGIVMAPLIANNCPSFPLTFRDPFI